MKILLSSVVFMVLIACNSTEKNEKVVDVSSPIVPEASNNGGVFAVEKPDSVQLPAGLKFRGRFYDALKWNDSSGENILVSSVLGPVLQNEEEQTAELHSFHFIKRKGSADFKLLWKLSDAEKSCPFDITAGFLKDATTITDLDNDGIAETTIHYKLACRSDVSPAYMKIIMHEDTAKYSLRGMMWIKASDTDSFTVSENDLNLEKLPRPKDEYEKQVLSFGRYETEKEFVNAPAAFLVHARKQWMKYAIESWE